MRSLLLIGVEGYDTRLNDALFRPALWRPEPDEYIDEKDGPKTLVYFGGDIQNFFHLMDQSDPTLPYNDWSLETTAKRLGEDFPQHHIVVIRPSRIAKDDISCYDNFVKGNRWGAPKHVYQYDALIHLERLLMTISMKIRSMTPEALYKYLLMPGVDKEDELMQPKERNRNRRTQPLTAEERDALCWFQDNMNLHKYPLTLVGFSKGCVVLNQFLFEFHYARHLEPRKQDSRFISRIEEMFWLDGAHPLKTNTWIAARAPLLTFAKLGIKVHVHVSAYQVADAQRPWIGRDEEQFTTTLISLNVNMFRHFHASPSEDLFAHFAVLERFMEVERRLNRTPPFDAATCFMVTCMLPPKLHIHSYYILAFPNTSSITVVPPDTQTPPPLFRKTYDLNAAELVPGLFIMCNANLFKMDKGGYRVVLSVFQVMGPDSDANDAPWKATLPRGHPALPAPRPVRRKTSPSKQVFIAPVDLRTTLNKEHSFVTQLGSGLPIPPQRVILVLILRKSFELPPLAPSRFPRIRYRFDIWEDHTSNKIEYSATLSVLQVPSTAAQDRTYTKIEPSYERGIPTNIPDIPGDDTLTRPGAALCFSVLTQVPSTDQVLNDKDAAVNAFVYEDDYVAAIPDVIRIPQNTDRSASRPINRAIVSVGFRSVNGTADAVTDDTAFSNTNASSNTTDTDTTDATTAGQDTASSQPPSATPPPPTSSQRLTSSRRPASCRRPASAQPYDLSQRSSTAQLDATAQHNTTAQQNATTPSHDTAPSYDRAPTYATAVSHNSAPSHNTAPSYATVPTYAMAQENVAQNDAAVQPNATAQHNASAHPNSMARLLGAAQLDTHYGENRPEYQYTTTRYLTH